MYPSLDRHATATQPPRDRPVTLSQPLLRRGVSKLLMYDSAGLHNNRSTPWNHEPGEQPPRNRHVPSDRHA